MTTDNDQPCPHETELDKLRKLAERVDAFYETASFIEWAQARDRITAMAHEIVRDK